MFRQSTQRGFTLVELMIVIGIIALIIGVLTASFVDARRNARDRQRVADLAQIEFAVNAYREANRAYPDYPGGIEVGRGNAIDVELSLFWDSEVEDPLNDDLHYYYYHSDFTCDGAQYVIVAAVRMEEERNGNTAELCAGDGGFDSAYVMLIDGPLTPGAGLEYRTGTNRGNWWDDPDNQTWNQLQYEWEDEGSGWWSGGDWDEDDWRSFFGGG